jgi:hypothetical protein
VNFSELAPAEQDVGGSLDTKPLAVFLFFFVFVFFWGGVTIVWVLEPMVHSHIANMTWLRLLAVALCCSATG